MGTSKISSFVIALVWVSFFASIFALFTANTSTNYEVSFDESEIETYNKLTDLNTKVENYQDSASTQETQSGIVDLVGNFISRGYQTLLITTDSLELFNTMINDAADDINLPVMEHLKTSIILTVTIIIVIGVLLSAIFKVDL